MLQHNVLTCTCIFPPLCLGLGTLFGFSSLYLHMTHSYSSLIAQFTCLLCEAIPYLACANLSFSEFQNALVISLLWQLPLLLCTVVILYVFGLCLSLFGIQTPQETFSKVSVYYNGKSIEISQSHFQFLTLPFTDCMTSG